MAIEIEITTRGVNFRFAASRFVVRCLLTPVTATL
jgi:hypothetical protein